MKKVSCVLIVFSAILGCLKAQSIKELKFIPRPEPKQDMAIYAQGQFVVFMQTDGVNASLYDLNGTLISEKIYSKFNPDSYVNLYQAAIKEGNKELFGFLDRQGKPQTPFIYEKVTRIQFDMAVCESNGAYFLLDKSGNIRPLPGEYTRILSFRDEMLLTESKTGKGLIDLDGKVLLPPVYSEINFTPLPRFFEVKQREKRRQVAWVNAQNEAIIPFATQTIRFKTDHIEVDNDIFSESNPLLFFDLEGKPISPVPEKDLDSESKYSFIYKKKYSNGQVYGLQDSVSKKPLTGLEFSSLRPANHGLLYFERKGYVTRRAGYMRYNAEIVVEKINFFGLQLSPYDILNYNNVWKNGRWYDENGKELLPDYFKKLANNSVYELTSISDTTRVEALGASLKGEKFGIYDRSGKALTEEIYDTLTYVNHRLFQFNNKDRKGLLNAKGQELTTVPFDEVKALKKSQKANFAYPWLHFTYRKKAGLMTEDGKVILPAEYKPWSIYLKGGKYLWALKEDGAHVFEVKW